MSFRLFIHSRVKEGQGDAIRDLASRMTSYVKENEPGTTVYAWYMGDDGRMINEDEYTDDDALLTHLGNAGAQGTLDEFMALIDVEGVQVLGDAGDAAREALAGFGAAHFSLGLSL